MSAFSMITNLLTNLASASPLLIVYIAGAVVAMMRRSQYPRVSMFVLIGCGILIVSTLSTVALFAIMPIFYDYIGYQAIGWIMTGTRIIESLVQAAGLALIIAAVFIERPEVRPDGG
jgi:hypothetical protein